ncbi:MAG: PKD domain-containing protein, partial [Ginsengibacter sp.]
MKKLITALFIIFSITANATTYYFSASGNDGNSGTSSSSPWQTLGKLNSVFSSLSPGDNVLLNRGDVFYGSITISRSGSSGSPITIGAYGSGANPIISGFTSVNSWANLGNNIWESSSAVSSLLAANIVVINGVNTAMGRYPNSGYLTYESHVGTTSITSSSLSGSPNWIGAEAVIRKERYVIDRAPVTSQSGGTLNYISASTYDGQNNYGFFIQNDSRTLDVQNEWYYNSSTGKLRVYSNASPSNVQLSTIDVLVNIPNKNYITFDNISLQGSNKDAFTIQSSSNVTIQNCSIDYSGRDAIWGALNGGAPSSNFVFQNSSINHTNNNAINLENEFSGALISHNIISNTGMLTGMGGTGAGNYGTFIAVQTKGINTTIEYNEVGNTGYIGITFANSNVLVRNNFLNGFCLLKLDGAGIYDYFEYGNIPTGQKITNNIVINGIGDNAGTPATGNPIAHGIYLDEGSTNVEVAGNSVANCSHTGLYIHNSNNLNVHDNTSFNNGNQQTLFASFSGSNPIRNVTFKSNILVSKVSSQIVGSFQTAVDDIGSFGTFDYNYWARPIDDNVTFENTTNSYTVFANRTLAQWKSYIGQDANSAKSPKAISDVNDLRFEYNATSSSKTISLDANYIDVKNVSYNGSITLAPYTSAVLIRNGASTGNQSPIANAGPDQSITTSTANLSGSGTDADGTITTYAWKWVSGPNTATVVSSSSPSTGVTGMQPGTHVFSLTVTDNNGATNTDLLSVTVNAGTNGVPIANAGPDQTITTSTADLSGSGTVTGGTITSYAWRWVSGPNTATVVSSNSSSTGVTGMQPGVHVFSLTVTDNNGATNTDLLSVTVN